MACLLLKLVEKVYVEVCPPDAEPGQEGKPVRIGACYTGNKETSFVVWAPFLESMGVKVDGNVHAMEQDEKGYWRATCSEVEPGALYLYRLNNTIERPDPASCFQPYGVHQASQVVDHAAFRWSDEGWSAIPLDEMILYELHIGTFTPEGTFGAAVERIGQLLDTGVNTIEIMPVAQFSGSRSWGYDGVYPFAVQNTYGGPDELKSLVNECHKQGMSVILDVVYNHLGPEGNYLADFAPYFTGRYQTPWGQAINFDEAYSNEVRNFFIENALHWLENYHFDGLRLDAVHCIYDFSAKPFLQQLAARKEAYERNAGRTIHLIAESDLNDHRVVSPPEQGGYGIDAQWSDDFHHALHAILTGDQQGYYLDFGGVDDVVRALTDGFVYQGQYSPYRKRNHGNSSKAIPGRRMIFFCQNHDQVGNRLMGERLAAMVPFEALKLMAGVLLASPYLPLLFMGEEYGETAPFLYFADHSDPKLTAAVREGRKQEFSSFGWFGDPPDPESVDTFMNSKIHWESRHHGSGKAMREYVRRLIALRREMKCLSRLDKGQMKAFAPGSKKVVVVHRWQDGQSVMWIANFESWDTALSFQLPEGNWERILDSSEETWSGPGSLLPARLAGSEGAVLRGYSFALFAGKGGGV